MNTKTFTNLSLDLYAKAFALLTPKGHDYGNEQDRLVNFKQVSGAFTALTGINVKPHHICLMLDLLKSARIVNLVDSGKTPRNEALEDSFIDKTNYGGPLLLALIKEEPQQ